jgi:uncharacterized pyridoxal phosphate-containing UPF0001 family protein
VFFSEIILRSAESFGSLAFCCFEFDPCFCSLGAQKLRACRTQISNELKLVEATIELSMGMSGDYEAAVRKFALHCSFIFNKKYQIDVFRCSQIREGSNNVRVGSAIFGARKYP